MSSSSSPLTLSSHTLTELICTQAPGSPSQHESLAGGSGAEEKQERAALAVARSLPLPPPPPVLGPSLGGDDAAPVVVRRTAGVPVPVTSVVVPQILAQANPDINVARIPRPPQLVVVPPTPLSTGDMPRVPPAAGGATVVPVPLATSPPRPPPHSDPPSLTIPPAPPVPVVSTAPFLPAGPAAPLPIAAPPLPVVEVTTVPPPATPTAAAALDTPTNRSSSSSAELSVVAAPASAVPVISPQAATTVLLLHPPTSLDLQLPPPLPPPPHLSVLPPAEEAKAAPVVGVTPASAPISRHLRRERSAMEGAEQQLFAASSDSISGVSFSSDGGTGSTDHSGGDIVVEKSQERRRRAIEVRFTAPPSLQLGQGTREEEEMPSVNAADLNTRRARCHQSKKRVVSATNDGGRRTRRTVQQPVPEVPPSPTPAAPRNVEESSSVHLSSGTSASSAVGARQYVSPAAKLRAAYEERGGLTAERSAAPLPPQMAEFRFGSDSGDMRAARRLSMGNDELISFRPTGAFMDGETALNTTSTADATNSPSAPHSTSVISITIRGMSPLHANASIVHPFVRIWVVNSTTGKSLVQATASVPCAVTQPFDLRLHRSRAPLWNAEVALRLDTEKLKAAGVKAAVLLEVLDFGNETIHGFPLPRVGLYPICWGYLMLHDCIGRSQLVSRENMQIQMYYYPIRMPWYLDWMQAMMPYSWSAAAASLLPQEQTPPETLTTANESGFVTEIPSIYEIFKVPSNRKLLYAGGLVVSIKRPSSPSYVPEITAMLPYEDYLMSMLVSGGGSCAVPRSSVAAQVRSDARRLSAPSWQNPDASQNQWSPNSESYYRLDGERSLLPQDVLYATAVSGRISCLTFSHNGGLLALGVTRNLQYFLELRNPLLPDVPVVVLLGGHTGHLHKLAFQKEDRYLLSCSSDKTVRVWAPTAANVSFSPQKCEAPNSVYCVCTLPHSFPLYCAIFHQDKIVVGGFDDKLYVWHYEQTQSPMNLKNSISLDDDTLNLTATFTPELPTNSSSLVLSNTTSRVVFGELISRVVVDEEGDAMTLSMDSNEHSNRVWSVHTGGKVVCWRALLEEDRDGKPRWQISARHRAEYSGVTEVQVRSEYAIVAGRHSPMVIVFDATTSEQLRIINTRVPVGTAVHLLPDGEAFVIGVGQGHLLAWECSDGGLCTPASGYSRASPNYPIALLSWAESQQLCAFGSAAPCTEAELVSFLEGRGATQVGQSAQATDEGGAGAAGSLPPRISSVEKSLLQVPMELTLITIAGTPRRKNTIITSSDRHASDMFCVTFGGDLMPKRKMAYVAARTRAIHMKERELNDRNARLHDKWDFVASSPVLASSAAATPYDTTEQGARMNAIINFWRGLVQHHRHKDDPGRRGETNQAANRVLQYAEGDTPEDHHVDAAFDPSSTISDGSTGGGG